MGKVASNQEVGKFEEGGPIGEGGGGIGSGRGWFTVKGIRTDDICVISERAGGSALADGREGAFGIR
jgi:hypothetical protein